MHRRTQKFAIAVFLTGAFSFDRAMAETVNYSDLEQVFGEAVTTSATGKPQRVSDTPATMTIITAEQIKHAAAPDLPGILREYTDLDIWSWARGDSDVAVRGYNIAQQPRLLVMVNGREVYLDYFGYTNWNAIPVQISEIRQIEIVKGPATALFGFNAAAGVINIITYNALYDSASNASAQIGSQHYQAGSAVVSEHTDTLGIRLSAGGDRAHDFNSASRDPIANPTNNHPFQEAVSFDALAQVADTVQVSLQGSEDHAEQLHPVSTSLRAGNFINQSLGGGLSAGTPLGLVDAMVFRNYTTADFPTATITNHVFSTVTEAKIQDLITVGTANTFRLATEFRKEGMDTLPFPSGHVGYSVVSGAATWVWGVTSALEWTNAIRFDHLWLDRDAPSLIGVPYTDETFDRHTINKVSGNSGLVYKLDRLDTVRLNFSRGFQLPDLNGYAVDRQTAPASASTATTGNPYLQPTLVQNYELGLTHGMPELDMKGSVTLFYQTNRDLISNLTRAFNPWNEYENIGNSNAEGAEFGLDGGAGSGWHWGVKYRLDYIQNDLSFDNSALLVPNIYSGGTPRHLLRLQAGHSWGDLDFDFFGGVTSAYSVIEATQPNGNKAYLVPAAPYLDARIAYHCGRNLTVALSAVDMQSTYTITTSGQQTERQFYGTVRIDY